MWSPTTLRFSLSAAATSSSAHAGARKKLLKRQSHKKSRSCLLSRRQRCSWGSLGSCTLRSCTMNANKMLLHSYSAAFHAALLHVTKPISKHVRSATCVNAEEIAQRYTKWKKKPSTTWKLFCGSRFHYIRLLRQNVFCPRV